MIEIDRVAPLVFDDGTQVRSASAIAALGDGWLIAQDDATHAAWLRGTSILPVRLVPPIEGHDVFSEAAGTKHLKPDLEAACAVRSPDGAPSALLLGSGSKPARMRGIVVGLHDDGPEAVAGDLDDLYARVASAMGIELACVNLEGACCLGDRMRWFQRGNRMAGVPNASVDVEVAALLRAITGDGPLDAVVVDDSRVYELVAVDGVGLAITDAVALPDGRVLVSAAAEDTPNAYDDGPVVASALALLDDERVMEVWPLPEVAGEVQKVEGLAIRGVDGDEVTLLAVIDADAPETASTSLELRVRLPTPD